MELVLSKLTMNGLKVIAFDADDTLWINETYFNETEKKFCALLESFIPSKNISQELFKIEMQNLPMYGYGVKSFVLCMIETALKIGQTYCTSLVFEKIIQFGKEQLNKPLELIEGAEKTLKKLQKKYTLILITKGDLFDQERKVNTSGLAKYFSHVEILSEKNAENYQKVLTSTKCAASAFMMVGNSIKSDVLPVLEIGGLALHIPFHTTWAHEMVPFKINHPKFWSANSIQELPNLLPI